MFHKTDFPALLLDFGLVVENAIGDRVRGILREQDVVQNDGSGDVVLRSTVLTVASGAWPTAVQGDRIRTWEPDAPETVTTWEIRRVLRQRNGTPTQFILVAV